MEDTLTPFDSYRSALLQPLVLTSTVASFVLLNGWYATWTVKGWAVTDKQKAYVLSLLSSSTMTVGSIPLLKELWKHNWDLQVIVAERWWTVMLTSFFATFLFLDLSVGFIFYRKKIDLLTGWIHHTTYLITMAWIIKNRMATVFVLMCLLEAPTFILALGSINSKLRRDYVFAFFFVSTRILFHAYMIYATYACSSLKLAPTVVLSVFFPLHCYWFSGFISQQKRLYYERKAAKATKISDKRDTVISNAKVVVPEEFKSPSRRVTELILPALSKEDQIRLRRRLADLTARPLLNQVPERFRHKSVDNMINRFAGTPQPSNVAVSAF
ncbi:hypothetical protein INT43_005599 [Umbelopsis isabellina]|uniref:TLC domain-containing protein n=1 Tax=Mortierella isabellina TaxID=91625 RepID=A0A8H7PMB5_MORIS|nr:hypothetical protein INT43_005599 [Umbelopsis isabellina]